MVPIRQVVHIPRHHPVIIYPLPNTWYKMKLINYHVKHANTATQQITRPKTESGHHPNWVPNATTICRRVVLPDLLLLYLRRLCPCLRHGLDSPQRYRKGNRKGKAKSKNIVTIITLEVKGQYDGTKEGEKSSMRISL